METLASRLAEARKNSGKTQADVAEELHVTAQSVSAWECGNSIPNIDKFQDIAALFNVTIDWLLTGKAPTEKVKEVTANLSDRLFSETRMATYISGYCDGKQLYQTKWALDFAIEKHDGQYRKPGHGPERIPYIYHPLLLTCHAIALGLEDDNLLSACLLHDVCEDCGVAPEELCVNEETREAVRLLTKPKDFKKIYKDEKAYYDGIAGNRIATIVKLLDRCNNVTSMATSFTDDHIAEYIKETQEYTYPLMERARHQYPEYSNQLFLIRYHMNSVLETLRHHMRSVYGEISKDKNA